MKYYLEAACGSDVGRVRQNNEDNCYFGDRILGVEHEGIPKPWTGRFAADRICFGVFDGMGGVEDGQVASYLAAKTFAEHCAALREEGVLSEDFFREAVSRMNESVCLEAEARFNQMGTTAVMAGFSQEAVWLCNVGDSRIYRFRAGQLTQLSLDHVEKLPPYALQSKRRRKPLLTQCIGISPDELLIEPHIIREELQEGDVYLLCTDGLTDMIPDQGIALLLAEESDVDHSVQALISRALLMGGRDNITVLLIRVTAA